jgi:hypothetical protein
MAQTVQLSLRISPELAQEIEMIAAEEALHKTDVVRIYLLSTLIALSILLLDPSSTVSSNRS